MMMMMSLAQAGNCRVCGHLAGRGQLWQQTSVKSLVSVPAPMSANPGIARQHQSLQMSVKASSNDGTPGSFLTTEEAGLIEMSNLDMHERFLCRLTVSSLNLLRVIAEQEGAAIEDLNAGRICDWFQKDKEKRDQDIDSATLKWKSSGW